MLNQGLSQEILAGKNNSGKSRRNSLILKKGSEANNPRDLPSSYLAFAIALRADTQKIIEMQILSCSLEKLMTFLFFMNGS